MTAGGRPSGAPPSSVPPPPDGGDAAAASAAAPATVAAACPPTRRALLRSVVATTAGAALAAGLASPLPPLPARAGRPEGVNNPQLLPQPMTTIIDLEKWLPEGEEARLRRMIASLEARTGIKVRILTQRYPSTPGSAIVDYWGVDDNTIVLVADYFGGSGNLLKWNVGAAEVIQRKTPPRYWSLLASRYGNKFYVEKNGEDGAIYNSVACVASCLASEAGCKVPPPDPKL